MTGTRQPSGLAGDEIEMSVIDEVAAERRRQMEIEGWSVKHDDAHADQSLGMAAALYASPRDDLKVVRLGSNSVLFDDPWPWKDGPTASAYHRRSTDSCRDREVGPYRRPRREIPRSTS